MSEPADVPSDPEIELIARAIHLAYLEDRLAADGDDSHPAAKP